LRADPTPIADLTIESIVGHLEAFLDTLDTKPILMGHSAGGSFMQVLLDHGYGCAGVALNSAPTEGIRITPWTQLHSVFPALKNPLNHHRAVGLTPDQWKYAFTNGPGIQREALQGRGNDHRARGLRRAAAPHGRRPGLGRGRRPRARLGAGPRFLDRDDGLLSMSALTLTHIGGPTTLIEEGWRILTDPTFDAPSRTYRFGWGTSSARPRDRRSPRLRSDRSTPCCSANHWRSPGP
jgi:hypothetical protein